MVSTDRSVGDALAVVDGAVLSTKPVRLEGASLTPQLVWARDFEKQTFTLLITRDSRLQRVRRQVESEQGGATQPLREYLHLQRFRLQQRVLQGHRSLIVL